MTEMPRPQTVDTASSSGTTGSVGQALTMRAAIWHGDRRFAIETRLLPPLAPGEVRVRVDSCGVCLTEVHGVDGLVPAAAPPRLMGHEYGGVISAVGPGVTGLVPGLPVACDGREGYAEYSVLPADRIYPLPPGVPAEHAVFVEPMQCCLAAERRAQVPLGATVLVTGAGPMGLLVLQIVRRRHGARVIVSEPSPVRRALALTLGAAHAVDPREGRVREVVMDVTRGQGVAAAFEAAGNTAALRDCLGAVGEGGTVVLIGVAPTAAQVTLDVYPFHRQNLRLVGSYGDRIGVGFAAATPWLAEVDLAPLISHRFALAELAHAFEVAGRGEGLKVVVRP
ncbi:MAG: zinc-binding dehydrogenase [Chloroflexi bacterium]|nr:zinc-binding dehydrogenase [Chloroflexota bacterium]